MHFWRANILIDCSMSAVSIETIVKFDDRKNVKLYILAILLLDQKKSYGPTGPRCGDKEQFVMLWMMRTLSGHSLNLASSSTKNARDVLVSSLPRRSTTSPIHGQHGNVKWCSAFSYLANEQIASFRKSVVPSEIEQTGTRKEALQSTCAWTALSIALSERNINSTIDAVGLPHLKDIRFTRTAQAHFNIIELHHRVPFNAL